MSSRCEDLVEQCLKEVRYSSPSLNEGVLNVSFLAWLDIVRSPNTQDLITSNMTIRRVGRLKT